MLGMVYNFLPFMILPIYSVIVKLDHRLIEAARDLGADSATVFRRVTLPLSLPRVLSGITMVFVPAVSTFAISPAAGRRQSSSCWATSSKCSSRERPTTPSWAPPLPW